MKKICLLLFLFVGFFCSAQTYKRIDFSSISGDMYIANKLIKSNIQDWRLDITKLKDSPGYAKINEEGVFEIKGLIGDMSFVVDQILIEKHKLFDLSYDLEDMYGIHHYSCLANILDGEISFHNFSVSYGDCIVQSNYVIESDYLKLSLDFRNLKEEDIFRLDNIIVRNHLEPIDPNIPDTTSLISSVTPDKYINFNVGKHQKVFSFSIDDIEGGTDELPTVLKSIKIYNAIPKLSDFKSIINNIQIYQDDLLIDVSDVIIEKDSIQIFFRGEGVLIKNNFSSLIEVYSDVSDVLEYGLNPNLSFKLTSQSFVLGPKSSLMSVDQKIYSPIYTIRSLIEFEDLILETDFKTIPKIISINNDDWKIDSSQYYNDRYNYFLRSNAIDKDVNSFTIPLDDILFNKCDFSWSFRISNDDWNPSSSNKFCYYLFADNTDFKEACNAYAVGVDMEDNDDVLCLYRLDNGIFTTIAKTSFHWTENQSVDIRVLRTYTGDWSLSYSDNLQDIIFDETVQVKDPKYKVGLSSGLLFSYSKSRANKLMIDNLNLCIIQKRESFVKGFYLGENDQLCIEFSERVDLSSLSSKDSYILTVDNVLKELDDVKIVDKHIEVDFPILNGHFIFSFKNVKDIDGNDIEIEEICFDYFITPKIGDIVINEILCDPNDSQKEFLELYNTTDEDLYLHLVNFIYNDKIKYVFKDFVFPAHSYLLLCSKSGEESLKRFGPSCPVSGFSLANTSGVLSLSDSEGNIIDKLEYTQKWYKGELTEGYSLEKINPLGNNDQSNWSRCKYGDGCTPGMLNSVDDVNIFTHLVNLIIEDEKHILLKFDKALNKESVEDINIYHFIPSEACVVSRATCIDEKNIDLEFDVSLPQELSFELKIIGLLDIDGFTVNCSREIYIHKPIETKDIVINEILCDPNDFQNEFLELYNTTDKDLYLNRVNFIYNDKIKYVFKDYTFAAHSFLLLCSKSGEAFLKKFGHCCPVNGFSLAKTYGVLSLNDSEGRIIDKLKYSQKWYKGMSTKGCSLEKVDPIGDNNELNWSKCRCSDGCTPGMFNSVDEDNIYANLVNVTIENERHILLTFDKALDIESANNINIYHLAPSEVCDISNVRCVDNKNIELEFDTNLPQESSLQLDIIGLLDIDGFTVNCSREIYIPRLIKEKELLINEILYKAGGATILFLELYNNSENSIDLSHIYISDGTSNKKSISKKERILEAKSYIAISADKEKLFSMFANITNISIGIENFITCDISSLLDTDNISVLDYNAKVIDSFDYRNTGIIISNSVSLERISFNEDTNDKNNWTLGSSCSGWVTPGYANDLRELNKTSGLELENSTFRSCVGNEKEHLILHLNYPDTKFKLRIDVYDMRGIYVNILNETVYHENSFDFSWDGHLPNGKFATGIMYCVVRAVTSDGKIIEERKSIIAA